MRDIENIKYEDVTIGSNWTFHQMFCKPDHDRLYDPHFGLLSSISKDYNNLKNSYNPAPKLGYNGCIEFAVFLVYYNILKDIFRFRDNLKDLETIHKTFVFFQCYRIIGLAFAGATASEVSDMIDLLIGYSTDKRIGILQEREFSAVYLFFRDYLGKDLRKMEFNQGNKYTVRQNRIIDWIFSMDKPDKMLEYLLQLIKWIYEQGLYVEDTFIYLQGILSHSN